MNSTTTDRGRQGATSIAERLERDIREGTLAEGDRLPAIRPLAVELGVSPATVAAAYQRLRTRGLIVATRRGTVVAPTPALPIQSAAPHHVAGRDVSDGNPDVRLLPSLGTIDVDDDALNYGPSQNLDDLVAIGRERFTADGVPADHLAVVGGSHDGVERALAAHLLPGDAVAVEDPGFAGTHDLVRAMGMSFAPVAIDHEGKLPDRLEAALTSGAKAAIITNRAQNPTGAALSAERAAALSRVFDGHPEVLVIEDDHAGPVAGAAFETTVHAGRERWMVVRSFGKYLAPDLRVGLAVGDELTIGRITAKQLVGTGWVSQLLQRLAIRGLTDPKCQRQLQHAARSYRERRTALLRALEVRGVPATGRSGMNVWIPVARETEAFSNLLALGWIAAPGEGFRLDSHPAIRITVSTLDPEDIEPLADAIAAAVGRPSGRRV